MYQYYENGSKNIMIFKNSGIEVHNSVKHLFFPWGSLDQVKAGALGVLDIFGHKGEETRVFYYAFKAAQTKEMKKMAAWAMEQNQKAERCDVIDLERTKPSAKPEEYFKRCKDCGHVYSYDDEDIKHNLWLEKKGINLDQVVNYEKCPKCQGTNIVDSTKSELMEYENAPKAASQNTPEGKSKGKSEEKSKGKSKGTLIWVGIAVLLLLAVASNAFPSYWMMLLAVQASCIIFLVVFLKAALKYQKAKQEKEKQKEIELQREKEYLLKAAEYISLDKKYGVLTLKKCGPEVGNAFKIVKHYTEKGIQHPTTYTLTMVTVGGVTTGGITEHKGHYQGGFEKTDKAKLIYDNFVIEKIQLTPSDSKRARELDLFVDGDDCINVTRRLNDKERKQYEIELMVSLNSYKNRGYYTNEYEAMRFRTFEEVKRILEFIGTPAEK